MSIIVTPVITSNFYPAIARACGDLRYVMNEASLYGEGGAVLPGSTVYKTTEPSSRSLVLHPNGSALDVFYYNNEFVGVPRGMYVYYRNPSGVSSLLIDFKFSTPVDVPTWGVWSLSFKINFTS